MKSYYKVKTKDKISCNYESMNCNTHLISTCTCFSDDSPKTLKEHQHETSSNCQLNYILLEMVNKINYDLKNIITIYAPVFCTS